MAPFIYLCPGPGSRVQGRAPDDDKSSLRRDGEQKAARCNLACENAEMNAAVKLRVAIIEKVDQLWSKTRPLNCLA